MAKYLILIGIVVIGIIVYFFGFYKPSGTVETFSIEKECDKFLEESEACKTAVSSALEKYSGKVYSIDKTQISLLSSENKEEPKEIKRNVWLIGINLKDPLKVSVKGQDKEQEKIGSEVKVAVDIADGSVNLNEIRWKAI